VSLSHSAAGGEHFILFNLHAVMIGESTFIIN